jgi:hypothetical protein
MRRCNDAADRDPVPVTGATAGPERSQAAAAAGEWFTCSHCGRPAAAVHRNGAPRAVAHSKPPCVLYRQLRPEDFASLHADAPRVEAPR